MSELTDRVRRMLSQAQVFARDTPFEAVSRARQAIEEIDQALASAGPADRTALEALRKLAASRHEKYEQTLANWQSTNTEREALWAKHERNRIGLPLRARG
ncbi:MAG TPA: hypothetical protein VFX59_30245 [Polyangiales bacterium]|nr:hypothetical protein [Polyangiales bacterium]